MKMNDHIDMQGRIFMQMHDRNGKLVLEQDEKNDIVLTGRDLVAKMFINQPIDPISHIAIGTGSDKVDPKSDTALSKEIFRKAINPIDPTTHVVTTEDNRKKVMISVELDFSEGEGPLTEAALFNAETKGTMYNRVVFPTVNKTTDFKLTLFWEIIF